MVITSCPSNEQLQLMVDYMENHELFARKQIPKLGECGVDKYRSMWSILTGLLNAVGTVQKTEEQWEKFWNDCKLHAQDAMKHFLYWSRQTGHHNVAPLSEIDQRICKLFGHYGAGPSLIPEVGVYSVHIGIPNDDESWSDSFIRACDKELLLDNAEDCQMDFSDGTSEFIMNCNNMYQGLPSGSKGAEKPKDKVASEEIIYIASFVDQHGGNPSSQSWDQIAKKPLLQHLEKTGEWFKAFWEIKVTEVLNKQCKISSSETGKSKPLTRAEDAILKVVQGNVSESVSTFLASATTSSDSNSTDITLVNATDFPSQKRPSEAAQGPAVAPKKSKLTSLQVQKDGLKAINDGNETLAFLTDLLTEGFRNNELASMAQTEAINNMAKDV